MTKDQSKPRVARKMSEASDQPAGNPQGKPAFDENIKDMSERELKEQMADKMGHSNRKSPKSGQK
ncbi:MAG: hypothetical protein APF80_09550 [Alphaproteobacteria bacterium BRH_c36]|nr:MAG: hypothetical protein APF80_09550 [Alphaproteobacteria bacterium BRH_c36]